MKQLEPLILKKMVRALAGTEQHEIACSECFEEIDRFVDLVLAGKNAAQAMPLVQAHLDRCGNCREEYQALLTAIHAIG